MTNTHPFAACVDAKAASEAGYDHGFAGEDARAEMEHWQAMIHLAQAFNISPVEVEDWEPARIERTAAYLNGFHAGVEDRIKS